MRRLAFAALLAGCSAAGADGPPAFEVEGPDLSVWAHTPELETAARGAAVRIEAASGLIVGVNETLTGATQMFRSANVDGGKAYSDDLRGSWISITEGCPDRLLETVALHELLHRLGFSGHVRQGLGIMSPDLHGPYAITTVDLEKLCAAAPCSRFVPEVEN